jgi:hypothetical protein
MSSQISGSVTEDLHALRESQESARARADEVLAGLDQQVTQFRQQSQELFRGFAAEIGDGNRRITDAQQTVQELRDTLQQAVQQFQADLDRSGRA